MPDNPMTTTDLPTVTEAQIVAAQLRLKAADLIRLAEQLEATAPAPKRQCRSKKQARSLVDLVNKTWPPRR